MICWKTLYYKRENFNLTVEKVIVYVELDISIMFDNLIILEGNLGLLKRKEIIF